MVAVVTDGLVPTGDGHTELDEDERHDLIPTYIATRRELFDAEQRNITKALLRARPTVERLLDDKYLRELHRSMFGDVWSWAGRYRTRETNLGVEPHVISTAVRTLVDDTRTWIDHATYPIDEIGARFHHRLVAVHPFVNGNGRHGRVATDLLLSALGRPAFTWGAHLAVDTGHLRREYREALMAADRGDLDALLAFVRT